MKYRLDKDIFTILLADADSRQREIIKTYLEYEDYRVLEADNGDKAVQICSQGEVDLVILDLVMLGKDGYQICKELKKVLNVGFLPVVVLISSNNNEEIIKAFEVGADDFLSKPVGRLELLVRVKYLLRIRHLSLDMENVENVLYSMVKVIETRDPYTRGHSERVAHLSEILAQKIGLSNIAIKEIKKGALLHDIGKIGIRQKLITKNGSLTDREFLEIQQHPLIGEKICEPLKSLKEVLPQIRHHHEKLDGSGYPDGLKGTSIPLEVRIVSLADVYDALTSDRPYRQGMTPEKALRVIRKEVEKNWWDEHVFYFLSKIVD